jgi:hypothetical protein
MPVRTHLLLSAVLAALIGAAPAAASGEPLRLGDEQLDGVTAGRSAGLIVEVLALAQGDATRTATDADVRATSGPRVTVVRGTAYGYAYACCGDGTQTLVLLSSAPMAEGDVVRYVSRGSVRERELRNGATISVGRLFSVLIVR